VQAGASAASWSVCRAAGVLAAGLVAGALSGCGAGDPWSADTPGTVAAGEPADFPTELDHWALQSSWSTMPRAFSGDEWSPTSGPDYSSYPVTMNGCSAQRFLIRWRAVDEGVTVLAATIDTAGAVQQQVSGGRGWMDTDGCVTPGFRLADDLPDGSTLTDVTVEVQRYQAAP
jgi:hypothetical protein